MLNISLDLTGSPAGDYLVEYILHDAANGRTAKIEQPFRIAN